MFQRVPDLDLWLVPAVLETETKIQSLIRSSTFLHDVLAGGFDRWRATEACQCDSKLVERVRDSGRRKAVKIESKRISQAEYCQTWPHIATHAVAVAVANAGMLRLTGHILHMTPNILHMTTNILHMTTNILHMH